MVKENILVLGFNSTTTDSGGCVPETLEKLSYTVVDVTEDEMWQMVGEHLQRARLARKWKPMNVERAGGPSYKTVQAIEAGDVGAVESLHKCARALSLSLVDILTAVLASRETPLSPEAAHVVRKFSETTIAGRQALLSVANAVPPAVSTPGTPPRPAGATAPVAHRPRRPARLASTRRTSE
jgi:hypothetical protein